MEDKLWHYFSIGFFLVNTIAMLMLIEIILYKIPYMTIFLIIFACVLRYNLSLIKKNRT